jgi:hypothetical protein
MTTDARKLLEEAMDWFDDEYNEHPIAEKIRSYLASRATSGEAPVAWIVFDEEGSPEIAYSFPEGCHDHINEAIEMEIEGAEKWVVRPVYASPTSPQVVAKEMKK